MENQHTIKLAAFSTTGADSHLVVDTEVDMLLDGGPGVLVLTACGRVMPALMIIDLHHNQVSCERCRSVSAKYHHTIAQVK